MIHQSVTFRNKLSSWSPSSTYMHELQVISRGSLWHNSYGSEQIMVLPREIQIAFPVYIDQELSMKDHITKLSQSCYYQLCQIRAVRHSLTQTAIQTLVHAFVCTCIDFANSLLYGTSVYLLDRLQSVLNSAARLILKIGKYDPISSAIRRGDLHWLPIRFRVHFKLNSITSNCLAGQAPEYLTELCHSVNDIPARRNLRSSSQVQLLVTRFRKEQSGRRGFSVSSPQLWNLLPVDIQLHHDEHQLFRRRLKTHYMQQSLLHHWGSMSPVRTLLLLLLLLLLWNSWC